MTTYVAITSMNQEYYDRCGHVMVSSFLKKMRNIPLHIYNEDNFIPEESNAILMGWNLGPDYDNFIKRHTNNRVKTFSKKAYSIIHAMHNIQCDRLIWIDADCYIEQTFPRRLLREISDSRTLSTHFSVYHEKNGKKYHSCETGFFILNRNHRGFYDFKQTYTDIYNNDKSEDLRRFYDGEVYGKTIEKMILKKHKVVDLNTGQHKTPISRSVIAPYIQHFKAGVKDRIKKDNLL